MKKIFIAIAFFAIASQSDACSICGCGGGNLYMGLFPSFKSKFLGMRWNYSEYHTSLLNNPAQFSHNYYNSFEIWSGINIGNRWQVLAFLPYHYNVQIDDDLGRVSKSGIGDITFLADYKLFDLKSFNSSSGKLSQQLWIGGGIKIPTGSFSANVNDSTTTLADINAQIGTGSVDIFMNARHSILINNFGVNTSASYKIGMANNQNYKFGNKLTLNSIAFYQIKSKRFSIIPNAGLTYENIESNRLHGNKIILSDGLNSGSYTTGGHTFNFLTGVEFSIKQVVIGLNVQTPLSQNFAAGQTKMNVRGMVHVTFAL